MVKKGYMGVTTGEKGVTRGDKGYMGLQGVKKSYRGLQW